MKYYIISICFLLLAVFNTSCKKTLDAKPDLKLSVPQSLDDLQAILDQTSTTGVEPSASEAASDNYYITTAGFNALVASANRAIYTWQDGDLFAGVTSDWGIAYRRIYYCNTALDELKNIQHNDQAGFNNIKGQALFKRAKSFWHVADIWALAYDSITASSDLGIPLRLNSNFNEPSVRASVKESYQRIISDLKEAAFLLPVTPLHPIRPCKPAAFALLSRVYLAMRNYRDAKLYADSAIALFPALLDYNSLSNSPVYPFSNPNAESIYVSSSGGSLLSTTNFKVDSNLYALYAANDLRKILFFKSLGNNQYSFRGSYANSNGHFSGLSSSELYLTRAECNARAGNLADALTDLNSLLIKRYKAGTFVAFIAVDTEIALAKILEERRKELLMRFTRWMDIKRLNKEGAGIVLKRFVNNTVYELQPNSLRYAMALPEDVLDLTGMPQNPR